MCSHKASLSQSLPSVALLLEALLVLVTASVVVAWALILRHAGVIICDHCPNRASAALGTRGLLASQMDVVAAAHALHTVNLLLTTRAR